MPASPGVPVRTHSKILVIGFILYSILILGSMATMSIGAGILGFSLVLTWKSWAPGILAGVQTRRYFRVSVILASCCALTLLISKFYPWTFQSGTHEFSFFREIGKLWYLFWPLVLAAGFRSLEEKERQLVIKTWLITFAAVAAIGVLQYFTGFPRPQAIPGNDGRFHATIFFGHHLSTASILIFPFFACLDLAVQPDLLRKFGLSRRFAWVAILLGFVCLVFTYSRTLWVALPLGMTLWLIWILPKRRRVAACVAMVLLSLAGSQIPAIHNRLLAPIGIGERQQLWKANLELFQRSPWVGTGWLQNESIGGLYLMEKLHSTDVFAGHAHNNFIHMLGGTGIVGTLPWLAWCALTFLILFHAGYRIPFFRGLVCAWVVFHINGLTQVNFWEGKVLHQMMWVTGLALFWAETTQQRRAS